MSQSKPSDEFSPERIFLIGYRGTGKTCVAKLLAEQLACEWLDVDHEIEAAAGKTIAAIFADDGERAFRDLECQAIERLVQGPIRVLAFGGGAVLREANQQLLAEQGTVVWLRAEPETILQRTTDDPVSATQRPNLTADGPLQEIVNVLAERMAIYRQCADLEVDTEGKTLAAVADEILERLSLSSE